MTNLQRRIYGLVLMMHPPGFRKEFCGEMLLDFEVAIETLGFVALIYDAVISTLRQWGSFLFDRQEGCATPGASLLAGEYVVVPAGGLTLVDLIRSFALSAVLITGMGFVDLPANGAVIYLKGPKAIHSLTSEASRSQAVDNSASRNIIIRDVTIIDIENGRLDPHRTVTIHGRQILSVVAAGATKPVDGPDEVDGRGKFLIPALWDMHTHITVPERDFPMYLANGVLGVRNMGGIEEDVFRWKRETANGTLFGPRMFVSGPIVDGAGGPAPDDYAVRVSNAAEARKEVETLKAAGSDFVKVYDGLSPESYFAIATESKKTGLPFVGHVPTHVTILDATNAGQRSIEHAIELRGGSTAELDLIDADKKRKEELLAEAMRTQNFSLIPETIARNGNVLLDHMEQAKADALYKALVRNGTYLCPTLDVKEWLAFADDLAKQKDAREQYISPDTLHYWQPEVNMLTKYRTPAYIEFRKREYATIMAQIPREQAAGVQLLAGTDLTVPFTYAGFSVHEEMALFVKSGLTPLQALQTATTHPVEFFGLKRTMGSVTPGKLAELVVLEANPLEDIRNTEKIAAVLTHGRLLRRSDLDALLKQAAKSAQRDK